MSSDLLGGRMKKYEYITRTHLIPRTPVIIRIDGRAFHTFTRGFKRPFDDILITAMHRAMKYLCKNIQGCVLGYTQSDEISLALVDYQSVDSMAWFDNNVQKIASVAASMATFAFNRAFDEEATDYKNFVISHNDDEEVARNANYLQVLIKAMETGAMFDARVFNLSKEEVCNYFLWRQKDAIRNAIQMVGHAYFPHSALIKKSSKQIIELLQKEKGIDWEQFPVYLKRGVCCIKTDLIPGSHPEWIIDYGIPEFLGQERQYIDRLIYVGD